MPDFVTVSYRMWSFFGGPHFSVGCKCQLCRWEISVVYGIPQLSAMTGQGKSETEGSEPQAIVYEGKTPQRQNTF